MEIDLCRTLPPRFLLGMFNANFNNFLPDFLPTALNDILNAPKRMPTMGMFICVFGSNSRKLPVCEVLKKVLTNWGGVPKRTNVRDFRWSLRCRIRELRQSKNKRVIWDSQKVVNVLR